MPITYNLGGSGTVLTISQLRLTIGDTTDGAGVLPGGTNFTDAEITYFYDTGGGIHAGAALAAASLARAWANQSDMKAGPLSKSLSQVAARWASEAVRLTALTAGGGYASFAGKLGRQDGYAYNAGTVEVAP